MQTLPDVLPTEEAKNAYYGRIEQMASNAQVQRFAREELVFFFHFDQFLDANNVRRWSALSGADPQFAASCILRALSSVDSEQRLRIVNRARREAVGTLVRLAWRTSTFHDAAIALALLAEAENETWGNNATGEFIARFQMYLGGTAVPYVLRLSLLDELLKLERPALTKLVVKALSQIGNDRASRMGSELILDELPEREWMPTSREERIECYEHALTRLTALAKTPSAYLKTDLVEAAQNIVMLLRVARFRLVVSEFFRAVRAAFPEERETLRRITAMVPRRERKYWKELGDVDLAAIDQLVAEFEDHSLHARLLKEVGQHSWDREDDTIELDSLAIELVKDPAALELEWPWLTSGEAAESWRLGQTLAKNDPRGELDDLLPALQGRGNDLRIICGYLQVRRQERGTDWFNGWVSNYAVRKTDIPLLFEVSWRCDATTISIAWHVAQVLREHVVSHNIVAQLGFGRWGENLPFEPLAAVVNALTDSGHETTAIAILENRLSTRPEELNQWEELALRLVTNQRLIRGAELLGHYWKQLVKKLLPRHARSVAKAIFREQVDRESGTWFAEFSPAAEVLRESAKADPRGVWDELVVYLESRDRTHFSIGFAPGVVEHAPHDDVIQWVSKDLDKRGPLIADFIGLDFSRDNTLAAQLLGEFGDNERVSSAFFAQYVTGSWSGSASMHWLELAEQLQTVAKRTALPKLRSWVENAIPSLRSMAERDIQQEKEWDLRRN